MFLKRLRQFRICTHLLTCCYLLGHPQHVAEATVLLSLLASIQDYAQELSGRDEFSFGTCNGCFCIPNSDESCPLDRSPPYDYGSLIPVLRSLTWNNPYTLDCDPYDDDSCETMPALQEGGACVVDVSGPEGSICPDNWSYSVSTYAGTFENAVANSSLYVTHEGPCGACSSLQDLSVYLEEGANLRDRSAGCGFRGLLSQSAGISCFQDLGFTEGCSAAWYYNTKQTAQECLKLCAPFSLLNRPPTGPPPQCALAQCLACDEKKAGPLFKKFAGRTRRNSGVLSDIVRPCNELVALVQKNPCLVVGSKTDTFLAKSEG